MNCIHILKGCSFPPAQIDIMVMRRGTVATLDLPAKLSGRSLNTDRLKLLSSPQKAGCVFVYLNQRRSLPPMMEESGFSPWRGSIP